MTHDERVREMAQQIRIGARVCALKQLARDTSKAYQQMEADAADRDLPERHRQLRRMLLGRLLPPPRNGE